ncbi:hypothetical protein [Acidianus sp. RZ1]|uniref:hypothetical protein n=1 Tax=Acidianus sp. RZ1 TaxID=1540082 RepID=UPI0014927F36|nr:hypothetical protein [Acidianus sp. RZ1]NON61579.1 hypothetical protein [Acidianus sp. RZ1]
MNSNLFKGNVISLVASVFILAELIVLLDYGLNYIFSLTSKVLLWIIFIMAIPYLLTYSRSKLRKDYLMRYPGSIAVILGFIGLILVTINLFQGIYILLIGYAFEPIAGISIFLTLNAANKLYSALFFYGAVIFALGLPLYLYDLGIIAIIGDIVKIIGLSLLVSFHNKLKIN